MVVGIGTVIWKFEASDWTLIYLPLLCYHLPTADIRLISPQTYHQLHGNKSWLVEQGCGIVMDLPDLGPHHPCHKLSIPIDKCGTNLLVMYQVSCDQKERDTIGPNLRSALARHALDFQGSWEEAHTAFARKKFGMNQSWNSDRKEFDFEFRATQA